MQNVLPTLVLRIYGRADIKDWPGGGTFQAWTMGAWIRPLAFKRRLYPVVFRDVVVIVASYFVPTQGRKNDILHSKTSVVHSRPKFGSPWWSSNLTQLMRCHGDYIVFLPIVLC